MYVPVHFQAWSTPQVTAFLYISAVPLRNMMCPLAYLQRVYLKPVSNQKAFLNQTLQFVWHYVLDLAFTLVISIVMPMHLYICLQWENEMDSFSLMFESHQCRQSTWMLVTQSFKVLKSFFESQYLFLYCYVHYYINWWTSERRQTNSSSLKSDLLCVKSEF